MSFVSRGFRGRRREDGSDERLPPGQYETMDFPVLSAGPTPHIPVEEWTFSITGEVGEPKTWSWEEFLALPSEPVNCDIHCVTKWSKLGTTWEGVSVDTLLENVEHEAVLRQSRRLRSTSTPSIVRAVSIRIQALTVSHSTAVLGKTIPA